MLIFISAPIFELKRNKQKMIVISGSPGGGGWRKGRFVSGLVRVLKKDVPALQVIFDELNLREAAFSLSYFFHFAPFIFRASCAFFCRSPGVMGQQKLRQKYLTRISGVN